MTIYSIGVILFFILAIFFIALIHNEKLIEKYEGIKNYYNMFNDMPETMCMLLLLAICLWPITLSIMFICGIGYCLFKVFYKLIDHFVK
jgi:nitrate reductase NapE component